MRLPEDAHRSQPWRIHELTHDFRLEDVWDLPASGRAEDFPRLVELMTGMDPGRGSSRGPRAPRARPLPGWRLKRASRRSGASRRCNQAE